MKRLFMMAAAAVGLASATTAPDAPAPAAHNTQAVAPGRTAKPAQAPAQQETPQQQTVKPLLFRPRPVQMGPVNYLPINQPRRVKYGKRRWIVLT